MIVPSVTVPRPVKSRGRVASGHLGEMTRTCVELSR